MSVPLVHNTSTTFAPGRYHYRATVGTGGVTVELGDGAGAFQNMIDGVFAADSDGTIVMSHFPVRVQLTGTAVFSLSKLPPGA